MTLLVTRPSRFVSLRYYVLAILLVALTVAIFFNLIKTPEWEILNYGFREIASLGLLFLALISILTGEFKRLLHKYVITDARVIRSDGMIKREMNFMPYSKVKRVELRQSVIGRLIGVGDVVIDTGEDTIVLNSVRRPRKIEEAVAKHMSRD